MTEEKLVRPLSFVSRGKENPISASKSIRVMIVDDHGMVRTYKN
jgi:hypothetical protein